MSSKQQQILIYILLGVIVVMFGYIVVTNRSAPGVSQSDLQRLERRLSDKKQGASNEADPYEKNEVKNTLLKGAADTIQACYKEWQAKHPEFVFGRISVDWTINASGATKNVSIMNSDIDDINSCVVGAISKLSFPPPPDNQDYYVSHKFLFKKEDPQAAPTPTH